MGITTAVLQRGGASRLPRLYMRGEAKNQTRFVPGGNLHCCYNRASLGVTKATGLKRVNIRLPASSQRRELVEGAPGVPPRRGRRHGFQIDGGTAELMRLLLNDDEFLRLRQSEGSDQGAPRCIRRTEGDNQTMSFREGWPRCGRGSRARLQVQGQVSLARQALRAQSAGADSHRRA